MTPPQYPAAFEPDAVRRRPAEPEGRRRSEMQGSLFGESDRSARHGSGPPAAPSPAPHRPARFDLRVEFAALASEPDPFMFQERSERLIDRFDREHGYPALHASQRGHEVKRDRHGQDGSRPMPVQAGFEPASGLAGELAHAGELPDPFAASPNVRGRRGTPASGLSGELPLSVEGPMADRPPMTAEPDSGPGMPPLTHTDRGAGQFTGSLMPPGAGESLSGPGGPPLGPRVSEPPGVRRGEPPISPPSGVPRMPDGMMPPGAGESLSGPGGPPLGPRVSEPPGVRRGEPPISPPSGVPRMPDGMMPPVSPPSGLPRMPQGSRRGPSAPPNMPGPPPPPPGAAQRPLAASQGPPGRAEIAPPPPKPQTAGPSRYQVRSDGGFGPMGSGNWGGISTRTGYQGRGSAWTSVSDEGVEEEEHHNVPQLHTGSRHRPGESDGQTPQFLVEDDLYDDQYGERRLVAPPVLGETPASFRDF